MENDIRDMVIETKTTLAAHLTECARSTQEVKETLRDFREGLRDLRTQVNIVQIRIALFVGGLVVLTRLFDYFVVLPKAH